MSGLLEQNIIPTLVFILLVMVLGMCVLLVIRRIFISPFLRRRAKRTETWGELIDRITGRLSEPTEEELKAFSYRGRWARADLEETLFKRLDLLRGKSRIPLAAIFEKAGLQKLALAELESSRTWTRRRAADKLGRGGNREVATALLLALRDDDEDVRAIAARSLGKLGVLSAAPYMVSLLPDLSEDRCIVVANTLIDIGEASINPLQEMLDNPDEKTRYFAALTIANICDVHACAIGTRSDHPLRRETDLIDKISPEAPRKVQALLYDSSPRVRRAAVEALDSMCIREPGAMERLAEMLHADENAAVRAAAATALGAAGEPTSADVLTAALADDSWEVGYAASRALVASGEAGVKVLAEVAPGSSAARWIPEIMELAGEAGS